MGACLDRCELECLLQGLERLTEMHESIATLQGPGLLEGEQQDYRQPGQNWQLFEISPAARSLLNRVLVHHQIVSSEEHPPKESHGTPAAPQHSHPLILVSPNVDPNANHQYPLLFSHIRERYQSIVEELMETDEPNNQTLSASKLRQASGAFLCRYRGCPRAAQGFHSSELRETHEESHRPRFQCGHATCGLFGTTFNSRAALKKHAARYHDEDNTASVPNSLTRKPRVLHEDRTLFTFSDAKTKRKAEDSRIREEHSESLRAPVEGRTTLASSDSRHSASDLTIGNSTPSTNALPHLDGTMSDLYHDEIYDPTMAQANLQTSPFRDSSQFAVVRASSSPSIPTYDAAFSPAAQIIRQRQKLEADTHAYAQHQPPRSEYLNPSKTISPSEAYLDFNTIKDNAKLPLSPQVKPKPRFPSHKPMRRPYSHKTDKIKKKSKTTS